MSRISNLSPTELKRRIDRAEPVVLLDVRGPDERAWCAIAAPAPTVDLHIPMGELPHRAEEVRSAATGPVVVYCHHGVRSLIAARWLAAHGLTDLYNLDGGIDAWSLEVDPAVRRY